MAHVVLPHTVEYLTPSPPSVEEVIETLQANAKIIREIGDLLEGCVPGLSVERIDISVREVKSGSLSEVFAAALFLTYQKELEAEVPALIEKLTGVYVDSRYDSIVTVVTMLLLFYSLDFAFRRMNDALSSRKLKKQLDGLVSDTARMLNASEEQVRTALAQKYTGRRLRGLAATSVGFFRPSKNQNNSPVRAGHIEIDHETVAEVPSAVTEAKLKGESSRYLSNVRIQLLALDLDQNKRG